MYHSRCLKLSANSGLGVFNILAYGSAVWRKPFSLLSSISNNLNVELRFSRLSPDPKKRIIYAYPTALGTDCERLNWYPLLFSNRSIHTGPILLEKHGHKNQLTEHVSPEEGQITIGHKVAQAGKDASYSIIMLVGFGVTGLLVWYVVSELLFSFSPNSVYSKAFDIAKDNYQVKEIIGESVKGYGEETSRGRRRHVSYQEYVVDDVNYMRVKFYISGSKGKATVYADAKATSRGNFEFRYIFLETQGYPSETLILLDNR